MLKKEPPSVSNAAQADNPTISEFSTTDSNRSAEKQGSGVITDKRGFLFFSFFKKKKSCRFLHGFNLHESQSAIELNESLLYKWNNTILC